MKYYFNIKHKLKFIPTIYFTNKRNIKLKFNLPHHFPYEGTGKGNNICIFYY